MSLKEVIPTQLGVLKRLKKMDHKPSHSSERSKSFSLSFTFKPQLNRKRVVFREIPTPVSPASKKRIAKDMAKRTSKKQKKMRKLIISEESMDEEVVLESPLGDDNMAIPSPTRNSPIKLNFEEIGNSCGSVKASNVDATTNQGDPSKISNPEKTTVILPEVLLKHFQIPILVSSSVITLELLSEKFKLL
ncbi:unnamed protein product [Lactuca saligna]|uniref:Uncharacterized protein n=1 Tax=Lactuca saligna TaxID=75948 RepID=A0AA35Z524_LACSI|nr:unnamed protein product [Lactuca saligna]